MEHIHLLPKRDQALVKKIAKVIKPWGGTIETRVGGWRIFDEDEDRRVLGIAPFDGTLACSYDKKKLYLAVTKGHKANISGLIHEAGHVFACTDLPAYSQEMDFLGWEYQFAKQLGVLKRWYAENEDYAVDYVNDQPLDRCAKSITVGELSILQDMSYTMIGEMIPPLRKLTFKERTLYAQEQGMLTKGNVLCTVRK